MNRSAPHQPISSRENQFVKLLRSLAEPKYRKKEQAFIIEGIKMVEEALRDTDDVISVVAAPSLLQRRGKRLLMLAESKGVEVTWITERILDIVSESKTPQPVMGVVRMRKYTETNLMRRGPGLFIIAHELQDPGNIGTIIRTAEAVGASGIGITNGTVDPYGPKAVRASMGSILRVPVVRIQDPFTFLDDCPGHGFQTVGLSLSGEKSIFDLDLTQPIALIVGTEGAGLAEAVLKKIRFTARIPMSEKIDSLNAATAASVALYEAYRQRHHAKKMEVS